jgi:hypothetical protein
MRLFAYIIYKLVYKSIIMKDRGNSTVLEHLTHHHKGQGVSQAAAACNIMHYRKGQKQ